jgi:DNA-binding transcriptional LysR family regulator
MVLMALDHRLAHREPVTLDDIADEPTPRLSGGGPWNAYWRIDPRPDGTPAPDGPVVGAVEDKNEFVAAGQAVAIVPAGIGHRPDLTTVPLEGVETNQVVLATRAGDRRLITSFRACAEALLKPR